MKVIYAAVEEDGKNVRKYVILEEKKCEICGNFYQPKNQKSCYCSKKCSKRADYNKNTERYKKNSAEWYRENKEYAEKLRKERYWKNPKYYREQTRKWNAENIKHKKLNDRIYKDRTRHGGRTDELRSDGNICSECGKEGDSYEIVLHHVTGNPNDHEDQKLLC